MILLDVIQNLAAYESTWTIFAAQPWTPQSMAAVAYEPDSGDLPVEAKDFGLKYFLEVFIAREILEDLGGAPDPESQCKRIIQYAINDA